MRLSCNNTAHTPSGNQNINDANKPATDDSEVKETVTTVDLLNRQQVKPVAAMKVYQFY